LKPRKVSHVHIASSVLITKANAKWIAIHICSRGMGSIKSGMPSIKSFIKAKAN